MAIDRSEYQISIKTTADISSAKAANDAMLELTKTAATKPERALTKPGNPPTSCMKSSTWSNLRSAKPLVHSVNWGIF